MAKTNFKTLVVNTKKTFTVPLHQSYSAFETVLIKDARNQGATNSQIAKLVNKKVHHGVNVRSAEGVRKIK